ncbi:hypothetical protein HDU85_003510 [Gaertneriomyces sp. JEL0708]|nr:hypothetical protein HDU85_003510 [Gaertneriomyces sp. JEL0708]
MLRPDSLVTYGTFESTVQAFNAAVFNKAVGGSKMLIVKFARDARVVWVCTKTGERIGKLQEDVAFVVGVLWGRVVLEGGIVRCQYNKYTAPIRLCLVGPFKYAYQVGQLLHKIGVQLKSAISKSIPSFNPHTVHPYPPHHHHPHAQQQYQQQQPTYNMGRISSRTIASTAESQKNMVDEIYKGLSPIELQEQEPNEEVMTRMYGHQKQALWFMCQRERVVDFKHDETGGSGRMWKWDAARRGWVNRLSGEFTMEEPKQWLGGILADEMGLGKTLSVLSLVVARRKGCEIEDQQGERSSLNFNAAGSSTTTMIQSPSGSRLVDAKTTLIVTPLSTIPQWIHQIQTHLRANCVSVHVYHGTGKSTTPETLSGYDIVLTTYGTVGAEYGRVCKTTKRSGDTTYMDMDGFSTEQYQASPEPGSSNTNNSSSSSVLGAIHFHRIILDEAHNIKERTTLSSRACHALSARYRWCLTGTPIHNRITDLYGLFRFLRVAPYDAWPVFNALTKRLVKGVVKGSEKQLEHVRGLLRCVTLRRTKGLEVGGKRVLTLPERSVEEVWLTLEERERRVYDGMWEDARRVFRQYEMEVKDEERGGGTSSAGGGNGFGGGGKVTKGEGSYANVLEMLLRLRQCVTHLGLLKGTYAQLGNGDAQTTTASSDSGGGDSVRGKTEPGTQGGVVKTEEEGSVSSEWTATRHAQHVLDLLRENGEDVCVRCHRSVSGVEDADEVEATMCEMDETNLNDATAIATTTVDDDDVGYRIKEDEEVICLDDDRKERRVGVARCGHVFCDRCLCLSGGTGDGFATVTDSDGVAGGWECGVCQVKLEKGDVVVVGVGAGEMSDVASASGGNSTVTGVQSAGTAVTEDGVGVGGVDGTSGTSVDLSMIPSTKTRALLRDLLATHRHNLELLTKPTTNTTDTTTSTTDTTDATDTTTPNTTNATHTTDPTADTTKTEDQHQEKPIKSVVFSQWTTYLSLLASTLDTLHLPYTLLIGSLPLPLRSRNLHRFRTDSTCNILLISLKAGGVGLNLTEASRVYLMEPYWNPAVEDQAMDRVWRMGQERRVLVKRFLVESSVEEGMEAVKRSKREVVGRALGEPKDVSGEKKVGVASGKRERVKELKEVFGFGRAGGAGGGSQ